MNNIVSDKKTIEKIAEKYTNQSFFKNNALRNAICILYALWTKEGLTRKGNTIYEYITEKLGLSSELAYEVSFINMVEGWVTKYGVRRFINAAMSVIRHAPTINGLRVALLKHTNCWLDKLAKTDEDIKFTIEKDIIAFELKQYNCNQLSFFGIGSQSPELQVPSVAYQYGKKMYRIFDARVEDCKGNSCIIEIKSKGFDRRLAGQVIDYLKHEEEYLVELGRKKEMIRIIIIAPRFEPDTFMMFEHPRDPKYTFIVYDMETGSFHPYEIPERFGTVITKTNNGDDAA